jgi:hypothetical protein
MHFSSSKGLSMMPLIKAEALGDREADAKNASNPTHKVTQEVAGLAWST